MFRVSDDSEGANAIGSFLDGLSVPTLEPPDTKPSDDAPLELMRAYILADLVAKDLVCATSSIFLNRDDVITWAQNLPPIQDSSDLGVVTYYIKLNAGGLIWEICDRLARPAAIMGLSSSLYQYRNIKLDGVGNSIRLSASQKKAAKKQSFVPVSATLTKKIGQASADLLDASVADSISYLGFESLESLLNAMAADKIAGRENSSVANLFKDHAPDQVIAAVSALAFLSLIRGLEGLIYAANGIKYRMLRGAEEEGLRTPELRYQFEQMALTRGSVCSAINHACYMLGFTDWLIVSLLSNQVSEALFNKQGCEELLALLRDHMASAIDLAASITRSKVKTILFSSGSEADEIDEDASLSGSKDSAKPPSQDGPPGWPEGSWESEDEDEGEDEDDDWGDDWGR